MKSSIWGVNAWISHNVKSLKRVRCKVYAMMEKRKTIKNKTALLNLKLITKFREAVSFGLPFEYCLWAEMDAVQVSSV